MNYDNDMQMIGRELMVYNQIAMHTKITITPQMREFNDAVQQADALTDGQFDQEPAVVLLDRLHQMKIYPHSARHLAEAIAGIAVKKD